MRNKLIFTLRIIKVEGHVVIKRIRSGALFDYGVKVSRKTRFVLKRALMWRSYHFIIAYFFSQ
jgi:hypothetical protein